MVAAGTFENPYENFGTVSAETFARILGRVGDIAAVVGAADGIVRDVAFGTNELASAGLAPLIGRRLVDAVTTESRGKVEALLSGASAEGRWRHLNFPLDGAQDVPISFQAFGLGGGRVLAVGRDERSAAVVQRRFIEAQRALEQNHARLRQADLRFQTMLALSDLAVLTLDGETLKVLDLNPVAAERMGEGGRAAVGQGFLALIERGDADRARRALEHAAATGRIGSFAASLRGGGERRFEVALFRYENAARLLVRLLDGGDDTRAEQECGTDALVARLPHGVVLTAPDLRITSVNRAFIDLAQLSVEDNALGQPLDRFLGRNGVDTDILVAALKDKPSVRDFATILRGAFGATTEIDVDAVHLTSEDSECYGFFIRASGAGRRPRPLPVEDRAGLAERMTQVVGRVSLKEIVRETTDVIERLCIETALGMTENNRAAASEMLGISRQSLYAKLSRYGIGGDPDAEN